MNSIGYLIITEIYTAKHDDAMGKKIYIENITHEDFDG